MAAGGLCAQQRVAARGTRTAAQSPDSSTSSEVKGTGAGGWGATRGLLPSAHPPTPRPRAQSCVASWGPGGPGRVPHSPLPQSKGGSLGGCLPTFHCVPTGVLAPRVSEGTHWLPSHFWSNKCGTDEGTELHASARRSPLPTCHSHPRHNITRVPPPPESLGTKPALTPEHSTSTDSPAAAPAPQGPARTCQTAWQAGRHLCPGQRHRACRVLSAARPPEACATCLGRCARETGLPSRGSESLGGNVQPQPRAGALLRGPVAHAHASG